MERKTAKKNILKDNLMSKIRIFVLFKYLLKDMDEMGKKYKNAKTSDRIELYQMKTILKELVKVAVKLVNEGVCGKEHVRLFMSLRLAEYIRMAVAENHKNNLIFKVTKDGGTLCFYIAL